MTWDNGDEIAFLGDLGKLPALQERQVTRLSLLQKYLASISLRTNWGEMREKVITKACLKMIAEEQRSATAK